MKKYIFALYSLCVLGFLAYAEMKTWATKSPLPIRSEVLQYDVDEKGPRKSLSTYRSDAQRTGRTDVIESTSFKPLELKWKVSGLNNEIHRASKSSPAVDKNGFYIADDTGYLRAYNWDGKLRWQFYSGVAQRGFHSTPLTDEDSIYIGDYAGYFYSLNKRTGKIRWLTKAGITVGSSPFLHDGIIYVGVELADPEGYLIALDAATGKWIWTTHLIGNHPHSSPTLDIDHKQIIMGSNTGVMAAYDMHSGQLKWSFKTNGDIKCAATLHGDHAYFVSWDGYFYSINTATGILQYRVAIDGGAMSCPSLSKDGRLVAFTGYRTNYVLDAMRGRVVWSKEIISQTRRAQASPLILTYADREVVIFLCESKSVCLYDLNTSEVLQTIKLGGAFTSAPVYFNKHLFLATEMDGLLVLTQ